MDTQTAQPKPLVESEVRQLPDGQREFMIDVRTQDLEVNMGPQHPATHGVMRILLRADGELITGAQPHLGYLHRCAANLDAGAKDALPKIKRYCHLQAAQA